MPTPYFTTNNLNMALDTKAFVSMAIRLVTGLSGKNMNNDWSSMLGRWVFYYENEFLNVIYVKRKSVDICEKEKKYIIRVDFFDGKLETSFFYQLSTNPTKEQLETTFKNIVNNLK